MTKKICLTGIKPTGSPHLGNYIGMIKPALELAKNPSHEAYYFIADYHALIVSHGKKDLQQSIYEVTASWIALGLDPNKVCLYLQSDIPEVTELNWILSCFTPKGLLNRAHAYKAKLDKNTEEDKDPDSGVSMGLYNYPVLMASDILFVGSHLVPVGSDQIQHIEIARDIAQSFNHTYGSVLQVPEASIQEQTKLVQGLDGRKMSKSYNNHIPLFLPEKKLRKMIMKITTDSLPPEAPKDPATSVIYKLFEYFSNKAEQEELKKAYAEGIGWGEAKQRLFEAINQELAEPRAKYEELMAQPEKIKDILKVGANKVKPRAEKILATVKKAIGVSL